MLDIRMEAGSGGSVWHLTGELTSSVTGPLRQAARHIRPDRALVVDLDGIQRLDRPGMAALVSLLLQARRRAASLVVRATPQVSRSLRDEGFDRMFPVVETSARSNLR
jgi:ABC-type transporter Mla MlaB component